MEGARGFPNLGLKFEGMKEKKGLLFPGVLTSPSLPSID